MWIDWKARALHSRSTFSQQLNFFDDFDDWLETKKKVFTFHWKTQMKLTSSTQRLNWELKESHCSDRNFLPLYVRAELRCDDEITEMCNNEKRQSVMILSLKPSTDRRTKRVNWTFIAEDCIMMMHFISHPSRKEILDRVSSSLNVSCFRCRHHQVSHVAVRPRDSNERKIIGLECKKRKTRLTLDVN